MSLQQTNKMHLMGSFFLGVLLIMINDEATSSLTSNKRPPTTCLDENGQPIDWVISYKLPIIKSSNNGIVKSGWAYASISSKSVGNGKRRRSSSTAEEGWRISHLPVTDHNSLIMKILEPIHDTVHVEGLSTVFYSDQPPNMNPPGAKVAHAKGVLAMDETTNSGFWLTHSVPRFPQRHNQKLSMPPNSRLYGQSFMCISFKLSESGRQIVDHLVNMSPKVYEADISSNLEAIWPEISLLEVEQPRNAFECIPKLHQVIKISNGNEVELFSKCGDGESEMFEWLNTALESNLYVESWRNGVGKMGSSCPVYSYHVNNVQTLHMSTPEGDIDWSSRKDHSKWAITTEEEDSFVCLSDINRMVSQRRRGGGAICMQCLNCWRTFRESISDIEACDSDTNDTPDDMDVSDDEDLLYE